MKILQHAKEIKDVVRKLDKSSVTEVPVAIRKIQEIKDKLNDEYKDTVYREKTLQLVAENLASLHEAVLTAR